MDRQRQEIMRAKLAALWEEVRELRLGTTPSVDRLDGPPMPLTDYVSANKPFVISNATLHWPALSLWTQDEYLRRAMEGRHVSVHLTPDGRADALSRHPHDPSSLCFSSAHVRRGVPFEEALRLVIDSSSSSAVAYCQEQNDCLSSEYSALAGDADAEIGWATEALGRPPEAVNLWIGGGRSETWFHKDHYENLYAVVSGKKHFLLLPPTDAHRLYIRWYPAASYNEVNGRLKLALELERHFDMKYAYFNFLQSIEYPLLPADGGGGELDDEEQEAAMAHP
ncbi:hypothetical protein QJS10_CPA10g01241 [Acorus calamus]|uniref:JmjC domain-containing protein n=1 Tax=Acorus calamus TaxID=4465 RepID=A0AAV9DX20_ACOCL|nr:hypothetical protein QJS10_CPA10g01241 [Acorus calamus]